MAKNWILWNLFGYETLGPFLSMLSWKIWKPRLILYHWTQILFILKMALFFWLVEFSSWNAQLKKSSLWDKTAPKPLLQINWDQAKLIHFTKNYIGRIMRKSDFEWLPLIPHLSAYNAKWLRTLVICPFWPYYLIICDF